VLLLWRGKAGVPPPIEEVRLPAFALDDKRMLADILVKRSRARLLGADNDE
jgi:hypothetical protein